MTASAVEPEILDGVKTFPYARKCPFSMPPEYDGMIRQDVSQVTLDGSGLRIWTITGYETVKQLLTDPRVSASRKHANFPFYFVAPPEYRTETSFIGYDGKAHATTRRKAALTFTARQVKRLRPRIEEIVDEHVDKLLASEKKPVDFHRVFALAVPMTVICELLGIPQDKHDFFIKHGTALLGGHSTPEERQAAIVEVNAYVDELIQLKKREPGDDLLSRAMADYEESGEPYTDRDLFNMVRLLMNGGHETTASQISLGTAALLENPDQLELLLNDPELVKPAVEELVRLATIGDTAVPRVALEDIEIGGQLIRKGDGILCLGLAANRDPEVFPEPEKLDITRGSRKHLGFGHGVHHCIGADLARLELEIVWSKLFQRIPTLRLAKPFLEIPRKEGAVIYGLWELPVTW
ncbi:cytochrome P450 [Streptomyces sp. NPDC002536]